ncbi:hypothetical protein SAMN04489727_8366 [Amycolatopsis tolypomycina]|uniref:MarR family transcriptional regulator n=1 Tax=Amycolatopsis tolypomycina TaxID=208445 RepID=A0A1H5BNE7_9PSEU|nr:hypothetical protein [Amycolatopsis tolypomycina]SED55925.1 hypothetical protein SAMN04489727_8366 [Amycolatopsis tolypomycina]
MRDTRARSSFGFLARALGACRADRTTGSLYLAGHPGGVVHLREGAVAAVDSPGAPGADALLVRSGRISEPDWSAVLRAGGVPRGIGRAALRLVATMAVQDGAFAIVAGTIDEYAVDPDPLDVPLPVSPGIELDRLLAETARRLDALASLPTAVSPHRERLAAVTGAEPAALSTTRRAIIEGADGRRSARDIAFLLGRNVFPVTVEVSRMVGDGLLTIADGVPGTTTGSLAPLRPRTPETGAAVAVTDPKPRLPRREPGASGAGDDPPRPSGWQVLPRLLNRIRAGPATAPRGDTPHRKGTTHGP